jgi:hypothetical protein
VKLKVELELDGHAFEADPEFVVRWLLSKAADKAVRQLQRAPGCLCTAPEADDVVHSISGKLVGTVTVEP